MSKIKIFFFAAEMVLMTVGVFADKASLDGPTNVYYKNGFSYVGLIYSLYGTDNLWSTTPTYYGQAYVIIGKTQFPIYSTQSASTPIYTLY